MKTINTNSGIIHIVNSDTLNIHKKAFKTKKDFERACSNKIIKSIIGENKIDHHENGAPYIKGNPELKLSISHSRNWFSIYLSKTETIGVDIQVFDKKIRNNGEYYINSHEMLSIDMTNKNMQLIWCIKEAVYKKLYGKIKDFKNEITVSKIESEIIHAIIASKTYKLKKLITEDYYLVYTI